jgi:hypothetical protein
MATIKTKLIFSHLSAVLLVAVGISFTVLPAGIGRAE